MGVLQRNVKGTELPVSDTKPDISEVLMRASEERPSGKARPYVGPSLLSATLSIVGNIESTDGDIQIDSRSKEKFAVTQSASETEPTSKAWLSAKPSNSLGLSMVRSKQNPFY